MLPQEAVASAARVCPQRVLRVMHQIGVMLHRVPASFLMIREEFEVSAHFEVVFVDGGLAPLMVLLPVVGAGAFRVDVATVGGVVAEAVARTGVADGVVWLDAVRDPVAAGAVHVLEAEHWVAAFESEFGDWQGR